MWIRYVSAPWGVRWAWSMVIPAAVLVAKLVSIGLLRDPSSAAWAWAGAATVVTSFIVGALLTVVFDARLLPYRALVADLSAPQRAQVGAASRRSTPAPDDSAVLAASAASLAGLIAASRRRPVWINVVVAAAGIAYASWLLVDSRDPLMRGPALLLLAAYVVAAVALGRRFARRPRLQRRLEVLQQRASERGIEIPAMGQARMRWRQWLSAGVASIVFGSGFAFVGLVTAPAWARAPGCGEALAAVNYIHDRSRLLNAYFITPGGPPTTDYQQWAQQLHDYAAAAAGSPQASNLDAVADLAARATGIVTRLRQVPREGIPDAAGSAMTEFSAVTHQLVDAEAPLIQACRG
ncbi:hypothetical protein [Mycobacteroides abscessus]|uniref:hypothetical protein n=1 Tax=Mycobacteroides abscessus TaxID=36809 RepID=UPI0018777824